jgi:hypothetical protein
MLRVRVLLNMHVRRRAVVCMVRWTQALQRVPRILVEHSARPPRNATSVHWQRPAGGLRGRLPAAQDHTAHSVDACRTRSASTAPRDRQLLFFFLALDVLRAL